MSQKVNIKLSMCARAGARAGAGAHVRARACDAAGKGCSFSARHSQPQFPCVISEMEREPGVVTTDSVRSYDPCSQLGTNSTSFSFSYSKVRHQFAQHLRVPKV